MSEKRDKLAAIATRLNKEAQKKNPDRTEPVAFLASDRPDLLDLGVIPTGNPTIDRLIGGGFPRGTIGMLVGQDGAGKSRAAMDMIAYNQRRDPEFLALFVHLEARGFPVEAASEAGIDLARLIILNAQQSGERTLDTMVEFLWDWDKMVPVNAVDLCVIDSIAAAAPEAELRTIREEGFAKEAQVARLAAMTSKVLRDLSGCGALGRACLLLINQVRVDVGGYGAPETIPGGRAIGHYPKISVKLSRPGGPGLIKEGDQVIGHTVKVKVIKNNSGRGWPQAEGEYKVLYGQGVDTFGPMIDLLIEKGAIRETSSGRFEVDREGATAKIRGRKTLTDLLQDDPELFDYLKAKAT